MKGEQAVIVIGGSSSLKAVVVKAIADTQKEFGSIEELKKEVARLTIEKDQKQEEWSRREREVEHKVGPERKRQEFEIEQARRETSLKVREENLTADKERFKAEMEFQRKHLEGEIGALRELVGKMLERLPSAEIVATLTNNGGRK